MSNDTSITTPTTANSSVDKDDNKNNDNPTHNNNKALLSCAMTSMSSKIIGREEEHFAGTNSSSSSDDNNSSNSDRDRDNLINMFICTCWLSLLGIVVDACLAVKTVSEKTGKLRVPLKSINMLKAHGKGSRESCLLDGYALNVSRAAQGMPKRIENAKIACLDMNLQKMKMSMGVQVRVQDPQ